ncbi:MAG: hypothetical protein AAB391_00460 [Patescibacteria group bacterium]
MILEFLLGVAAFGLFVGSIAAFVVFIKIGKKAKTAGVISTPLIMGGQVIGIAILVMLNFLLISKITDRTETRRDFAAVGHEVNSLKADNTAIRAEQETLKPLATNAAALLNMGTRVELADAKADRALEQLSNLSDAYVAGLNKLSTNISDRIDQRLMALRIALQREHAASMTQPTLNDGRIINPNFVPQLPPPPAPTAVAPQPPQPYVAAGVTVPPGYSVQRDDSSELAKVERRLAQLEKARQDAKQAQKSAKATQKVAAAAADKGSQAEQVALLAMKQVTELNTRQGKMDDRLSDISKAIDKLLVFMISTNVSLPALTDTNPPAAQVQPAQPAVPAPTAQTPPLAPALAPQPAPAVSAVQPPTNNLVSFTLTNAFAIGRSLFQVQRWPWEKGGMIVYEVTGWIKPSDNMVTARQIVQATTERFHNKNGVWFAGKDSGNAEINNKFVFEFGEALKAVRKGNQGWDHLDIDPVFRTNPNGGAISTNSVTRTNTRQAKVNTSLPAP